jgi:5-methylcytosine-specific restriction endonuclease McrA
MEESRLSFFTSLTSPDFSPKLDHKGRETGKFRLSNFGWDAEVHVPQEWAREALDHQMERPCSLGGLRREQVFRPQSTMWDWYPDEFHVWMFEGEIFLADNDIQTGADFESRLATYRERVQAAADARARREKEDALIAHAEAIETTRTRERKLQWAKGVVANAENPDLRARQAIPRDIKILVWERDGGRCIECGSDQLLEFDHIIPLALGGSNTEKNLQLLCSICNQRKGATIG